MRRKCQILSTFALIISAIFLVPASSIAQQVSIVRLLDQIAKAQIRPSGFQRPLPPRFGSLEPEGGINQGFKLTKGQKYGFVAVGDDNANDIDLQLLDRNGKVLAEDNDADESAVINFSPRQSGIYYLRVIMYGCQAEECKYAVGVYRGSKNLQRIRQSGNTSSSGSRPTMPSSSSPKPPLTDGMVINETSTNEKPPRALVEQPSNGRLPVSTLEVYVPSPTFNPKVENTVDASSSSEIMKGDQDREIPASPSYKQWIDFVTKASPKAVAFQPVSSITGSGSLILSTPKSIEPSTGTITKIATENPPVLGQSKPGALIDSVNIDHNRQFDQKTRGMAVAITSYIWNAKGQSGSINVYAKQADDSYIKSRNPGYTIQPQRILTSGIKVKIPSDNTKVNSVVYLPYPAFDLPSEKTSDLKLQVQIQLDNVSTALANDETQRFNLTSQTRVQKPSQHILSSAPKDKPRAFLINGYYGQAHPGLVREVLEAVSSKTWPYKLSNGDSLRGLDIPPIVGNWDDLYSTFEGVTLRSDVRFRQQMYEALRQLDPNVPVIFIGHSFGADSLMQVARCEAGKLDNCPPVNVIPSAPRNEDEARRQQERQQGRKILFFATLDPVTTGGIRMRKSVPYNMSYFFNRWTENSVLIKLLGIPALTIPGIPVGVGIPVDHGISGELSADFVPDVNSSFVNDQTQQSTSKNWDGSEIRVECGWLQVSCDGYVFPTFTRRGRKGTRPMLLDHGEIPNDMYVQRQILEALTKLLSNQAPLAEVDTAELQSKVTINVLENDSDPNGDPLTITNVTNGTFGKVEINSEGTVTYSFTEAFIQPPQADSFTYTISDGKGGTATAKVTLKRRQGSTRPSTRNRAQ